MKQTPVSFPFGSHTIGGILYTPAGKGPFPAVLYVPGFSGGIREERNVALAKTLAEQKFIILLFDFYDFPDKCSAISKSDMTISLQCTIIRAALDYLGSLSCVDSSRMSLVGHSLGAMTCLVYAPTDTRISSIVAQSPVVNFKTCQREGFMLDDSWKKTGLKKITNRYGSFELKSEFVVDGMKYNSCAALQKISCPVLLIYGDRDTLISLDVAHTLVPFLNKLSRFEIVNGADHIYHGKEKEVVELTVTFLKEKMQTLRIKKIKKIKSKSKS
ncbi:alpha/beta fold hydrolase [Candidatus Woesearchaeota archaeon]|nr:alpha/beta fold hydrolase [Candidatus Woesearchaeota archaeon]